MITCDNTMTTTEKRPAVFCTFARNDLEQMQKIADKRRCKVPDVIRELVGVGLDEMAARYGIEAEAEA